MSIKQSMGVQKTVCTCASSGGGGAARHLSPSRQPLCHERQGFSWAHICGYWWDRSSSLQSSHSTAHALEWQPIWDHKPYRDKLESAYIVAKVGSSQFSISGGKKSWLFEFSKCVGRPGNICLRVTRTCFWGRLSIWLEIPPTRAGDPFSPC